MMAAAGEREVRVPAPARAAGEELDVTEVTIDDEDDGTAVVVVVKLVVEGVVSVAAVVVVVTAAARVLLLETAPRSDALATTADPDEAAAEPAAAPDPVVAGLGSPTSCPVPQAIPFVDSVGLVCAGILGVSIPVRPF